VILIEFHNHRLNLMANSNYWKEVYSNDEYINKGNPQSNVGRTVSGNPIDKISWDQTVECISSIIEIDETKTILELCCGNGMLLGPLSARCSKAYGVDFSPELIKQLKALHGEEIITSVADVMDVHMEKESIDVVIIYFSIQHFSEANTISLTSSALDWLKPEGKLFIGDVPDQDKLWSYLNKSEYKKDYLERIVSNRPKIGHWFQRGFFKAFEDYFENVTVQVLSQPEFMINSDIRFDVLITKESIKI
jgi:ubiquinone/menaquinone biosynthesis C-methylase UbiE